MENKIIGVVAVVLLGVIAWNGWGNSSVHLSAATTAAGPNIENYIPAILYNNGYVSAKDISTTANLNAAIGTFSSSVVVTTTNIATSTTNLGCVQSTATSTATPIHFALIPSNISTTTFAGTQVGGVVVWVFGACPF